MEKRMMRYVRSFVVIMILALACSTAAFAAYPWSMISPGGGETFKGGSELTIVWTCDEPVSQVEINYSLDGQYDWKSVTGGKWVSNTGNFKWTLPNEAGSNVRIAIIPIRNGKPDYVSSTAGIMSQPFTIQKQADFLKIPPAITFNGVKWGTVVQSSTFTDANYAKAITAVRYNGNSLTAGAGGYSVFAPQDDQSNEYFIQIDRDNVTSIGSIPVVIEATGYQNAASTVSVAKDPDPQSQPSAPELLSATALSDADAKVTWKSTSQWKAYRYNVFRKESGGNFKVVGEVDETKLSYVDTGLKSDTEYIYAVQMRSVDGVISEVSNELAVTTKAKAATIVTPPAVTQPVVTPPVITTPVQPQTPAVGKKVIRFYVGSSEYYIDNKLNTMDTAPIVSGGRTLLPIAYATAPLGATVDWNAVEKKVTIKTSTKTIELWIGKNTAKINGVATLIDPGNPGVQPVIMPPGRTMLPLRFVTENLGCDLEWNPAIQEVKITEK